MRGVPTGFWGKLRRDEGGAVVEWHPLIDHCCDVAAVAEALLSLPLWRGRLARSAGLGRLDDCQVARLCVLSALHDLGKFTLSFQAKGRGDLGIAPFGHVEPPIAALDSPDISRCLEPLAAFGGGAWGLLVSAFAHHGQPRAGGSHQGTRWQTRGGLDPIEGARTLVAACERWFPAAFTGTSELPESPPLEHDFAGLVMLADWIGSDTDFFPYTEDETDRMAFSRLRAVEILRQMFVDVSFNDRRDSAGQGPFARVSAYSPRPAQQAVCDLRLSPSGAVAVLEAETGSGKTEAALAHFVRLFVQGLVDGLYFALPTRTAATQIFKRVREATARAFSCPPPVVLAVPGYLQVDDAEGQRLPHFEVLWPDRDGDRFRYRGWAAEMPKRYLAGAIVVGTVDQILLSSLMVNHAHLRATSLLRHLLVVDEVHASDTYMTRILEDVLRRHLAAGGQALLLSATLAAETRSRLMHPGEASPPLDLDAAVRAPYPLLSNWDGETAIAADVRERAITLSTLRQMDDLASVAACACAAARSGAKVLVLRNTVKDCIATQLAVEQEIGDTSLLFSCGGTPAPHHGRYSRDDRRALDGALEVRVGKKAEPGGCVVVATQTVQQSLDLDFDLLITDLCPIDVLLQRLGRLHRHERRRPSAFERPSAVVLVPSSRDLGVLINEGGAARAHHGLGGFVYPDLRVIEATWRLLEHEPIWRIPAMNRGLVEGGLHSSALEMIVNEGGERFRAHHQHLIGQWFGHRRLAELNLVDRGTPYHRTTFPSGEDERISTRLGEGDRRLRFLPGFRGPFGYLVTELVVPAFWARGAGAEAEPQGLAVKGPTSHFHFGDRHFVYDRLGLRPDEHRPVTDDNGDDSGP